MSLRRAAARAYSLRGACALAAKDAAFQHLQFFTRGVAVAAIQPSPISLTVSVPSVGASPLGGLPKLRDEEVVNLFNTWNAALATLDPEAVADLYAPSAVLLPTVSNQYRRTRSEIVDYFKAFLQLKPQGVLDQYEIRHLADGVVQNMGIYTFTLHGAGGKQVQARYSYTYQRQPDGRYLIVEHHSSAMPEDVRTEVLGAFDKWNAALATLDPEQVADCYAPGAVLLPTVSNQVRTTRQDIVDYFSMFLKRSPQGVIEDIPGQSPNIRVLAPGYAINSGTYIFSLTNPQATVRARYSFGYKKLNGEWKIVEHHSSVMPE